MWERIALGADRGGTLVAVVGISNEAIGGGTLGAAVGGTLVDAVGGTLGEAVGITLGSGAGVGSLVGTPLDMGQVWVPHLGAVHSGGTANPRW